MAVVGVAPPEEPDASPAAEILNTAEGRKIILAATKARPHNEEEISSLLRWAAMTRLNARLLDMVLEGLILLQWGSEEPRFTPIKATSAAPEEQPKKPSKSRHPYVSEGVVHHYDADCPSCKRRTRWRADSTGARCGICGSFVDRDSIGDEPVEEEQSSPLQAILETDEITRIMESALRVRGHTEEELAHLLDWASDVKTFGTALRLVLDGEVDIEWSGDEPSFRARSK